MKYISYNEGVFNSKWLSKFINKWFLLGRKFYIEKIIYCTFFILKSNLNYYPLFIFFEVLEKIKPYIGLKINKYKWGNKKNKKIKVSPYILSLSAQYNKSIFWLTKSIKLRKESNLSLKIYYEFYDIIFNTTSNCLRKKKDYYKYIIMFKSIKNFKW